MKRPRAVLLNQWGQHVGGHELDPGDFPAEALVEGRSFVLVNGTIADDYSVQLEYRALPSGSSSPPSEHDPGMQEAVLKLYNNAGSLDHADTFPSVDSRTLPGLVKWRERLFLLTAHNRDGGAYQEILPFVLDR